MHFLYLKNNMQLKSFFTKNWIHFAVFGVFLIATFAYFAPEFDGYSLKQHDVEQFKGMANETQMYREKYGEEPLWTNSMFGGMPTTQISMLYEGNIFQKAIISFLTIFGVPSGTFLLHLIGFYILALCLRIKPIVAVVGAFAFAFATYEIVIIQAGHNSKAAAVALIAPVLGAFIMAYRSNWKWGVLLSGLFMSFQLASNHLQVTYYLGILLFFLGLYELIKAIREKKIKTFGITTLGIIGVYGLALFINYGNISLTQDYAKHTIRGGNDVTIGPDGTEVLNNTSGLDKDYITNWSYGVGESFTLVSPYVKGSASAGILGSQFEEMVENSDRSRTEINQILNAQIPMYWGEQPIVSGPTYVGVVMVFLMMLGMIYVKDRRKTVLFLVGILALALSWGKNFMGLTDIFIDYVPGYNKFRTVTIIMVLIELIVPVIGIWFLDSMLKDKEGVIKVNKKPFIIASALFFVVLLSVKMIGLGDGYTNEKERSQADGIPQMVMQQLSQMDPAQLTQNNIDINNPQQIQSIIDQQVLSYEDEMTLYKGVRADMFDSSMNRSLIFTFLIIALIALYFFTAVSPIVVILGAGLLVLFDLVPVDLNYLNNEETSAGNYKHWTPKEQMDYPISSLSTDQQIMDAERVDPKVNSAIEAGQKKGITKAEELGYTGANKSRVVDAYKFSALNYATNYRVFTYDNPWGSSRTSYYHKNLGGYHGAKLRNIQNIFEFQLAQSNNKVFDMMNVKYFIQGENIRRNPTALGQAWFVKNIKTVETPNDEIRALGSSFDIRNGGRGVLVVNGESVDKARVYGAEKIGYVFGADTINVPLTNGISKGMEIAFVSDTNGVTNLVPKITLEADTANSFNILVSMICLDVFDPSVDAVMLKSEASKLSSKSYTGEGTIVMKSYKPNEIKYAVSSDKKQFAVFSEIYYPAGWKAFVDGKEVEILKVDYLLRGVEVEAGNHEVIMKFDIPKLVQSNLFSIIGAIILAGLFAFGIWKSRPKKT
jgi:hypothetical protein